MLNKPRRGTGSNGQDGTTWELYLKTSSVLFQKEEKQNRKLFPKLHQKNRHARIAAPPSTDETPKGVFVSYFPGGTGDSSPDMYQEIGFAEAWSFGANIAACATMQNMTAKNASRIQRTGRGIFSMLVFSFI